MHIHVNNDPKPLDPNETQVETVNQNEKAFELGHTEKTLLTAIRKYNDATKTFHDASLALKSAQTDMEAALRDCGINLTK